MIRGGVVLLSTTLAAAPGHAGPWEVFAERCLAPLEHFMPGRIDGLEPNPDASQGNDVLSFFAGDSAVTLDVRPGPICRVTALAAGADALEPAQAWRDNALASGRYVEAADGVLESNLWREPRLAVTIEFDAARTVFTAEETDLES